VLISIKGGRGIVCFRLFGGYESAPRIVLRETRDIAIMAILTKILEWQAAHPNITWIGWASFG
jgi:hypothetical protein